MARIVMKFGGTSVGSTARIRAVAETVKATAARGHEVVVVLSAMAGETNRLVSLAHEISRFYDAREYDVVVSAGEQVTVGLLAIALQKIGVPARSWLGWQVPVRTGAMHGAARIESIDVGALGKNLASGMHAVVAGFQGVGPNNRISTLGRGGSDTSAVALAAALGAERCDIYTDVDGVHTADPRIEPDAQHIALVSFEEMLELSALGARVLQTRSVEMAMRANLPIRVLSAFKEGEGTLVCEEERIVEQEIVKGVAHSTDEGTVKLLGVPDRPGTVAAIFAPLAENHVLVDMIVQHISEDGSTDLSFSCDSSEVARVAELLEAQKAAIGFRALHSEDNLAKVSIVGLGMRKHIGVAQRMFAALARENINIHAISTSEIRVSVLVARRYVELAVRAVHAEFGLGQAR